MPSGSSSSRLRLLHSATSVPQRAGVEGDRAIVVQAGVRHDDHAQIAGRATGPLHADVDVVERPLDRGRIPVSADVHAISDLAAELEHLRTTGADDERHVRDRTEEHVIVAEREELALVREVLGGRQDLADQVQRFADATAHLRALDAHGGESAAAGAEAEHRAAARDLGERGDGHRLDGWVARVRIGGEWAHRQRLRRHGHRREQPVDVS